MSEMYLYITTTLQSIADFLIAPPILYFSCGIMLVILIKAFKSIVN